MKSNWRLNDLIWITKTSGKTHFSLDLLTCGYSSIPFIRAAHTHWPSCESKWLSVNFDYFRSCLVPIQLSVKMVHSAYRCKEALPMAGREAHRSASSAQSTAVPGRHETAWIGRRPALELRQEAARAQRGSLELRSFGRQPFDVAVGNRGQTCRTECRKACDLKARNEAQKESQEWKSKMKETNWSAQSHSLNGVHHSKSSKQKTSSDRRSLTGHATRSGESLWKRLLIERWPHESDHKSAFNLNDKF